MKEIDLETQKATREIQMKQVWEHSKLITVLYKEQYEQ